MVCIYSRFICSHTDLFAGSDVIRMNVFGMKVIITNTLEASTTLLDKRSLTYSNRPTRGVTMMKDLYV